MATVQTDGSSAITSTSTKNDGGTVVKGGSPASDSPMTKNLNLKDLNTGTDYGSKVVAQADSGDKAGVQAASSGGSGGLAFYPDASKGERNFLIKGAGTNGDTNEINNDASTVFATAGSEYASVGIRQVNPIAKVVDTRRIGAYSDTSFNVLAVPSTAIVPGRTKGTGAGNDSNYVQAGDGSTAATDDAASPSRSVPGELTYHFGGLAKPTTDEYKARDAKE